MLFQKKLQPGDFIIQKEGAEEVLHINYDGYPYVPSIEDDPLCMSRVIEILSQAPTVTRIQFHQQKKFEYNESQTKQLANVARIYNYFLKQKKFLTQAALEVYGPLGDASTRLQNLQYIILNLLKTDPIGAYVESKRLLREERINIGSIQDENYEIRVKPYTDVLEEINSMLNKTQMIETMREKLSGYEIGTREIYKRIFRPVIAPDFMYTRFMMTPPLDGEEVDSYDAGRGTKVQVFNTKDTIKPLYFIIPPEFQLSEDKYQLLDLARKVLAEHEPRAEEFIEPERMRQNFLNIGKDLLTELATHKGMDIPYKELEEMANVLVRYTVGFGVVESILLDPQVQDININSPPGLTPIFIVHAKYGECITNIIPSAEDIDSWASKFRLISMRPLDEANPVLDTELSIPGARARVAIISKPLSPLGTAYSIRRHRDQPWTLPLFMKNKMITPLAAGLISFLIDGARTMLIAGTRGSGKTSLLGAVLVEIMRKFRVITVEDTLELPVRSLRDLGYNIQNMKVRSALATSGSELSADEGIRVSLRLGDSSLIVGEIRSKEAFALYEAMRVGALANVVAGTIHGDSPYGVFDRVVNDLQVPRTSFKATDIIIVTNPIKSPDGLHSFRRVTQITEVRKYWENDPLREKGFVDLMKYDAETDSLLPTDDLINGNSEILKSIGGTVKEWAGSWDAIWENILLRAAIKEKILEYAERYDNDNLLEAETIIHMNDEFHKISEKVREREGYLDNKKILFEWEESFKRYIKQKLSM